MTPLRAGVAGWPISHSKSPRLHGYWLEKYTISGTYESIAVTPEAFSTRMHELARSGWRGLNVTLPHKEAALAIADKASEAAREIGAANTLVFAADGSIHADNTDAFGFTENLRSASAWSPDGPALVLGAGGAARAVIHALLAEGAPEIILANRTRARADALAARFGPRLRPIDWAQREAALPDVATIVNTTSLGMTGQPPLDIDLTRAAPGALATDIVYTPLETPFLIAARAAGLAAVDGLGMLLHQARPGFHAWFGRWPEVDETLRRIMLAP